MQVLLVTSRESGRWVIPKGNFANTVSPHAAAAQEAVSAVSPPATTTIAGLRSRPFSVQAGVQA